MPRSCLIAPRAAASPRSSSVRSLAALLCRAIAAGGPDGPPSRWAGPIATPAAAAIAAQHGAGGGWLDGCVAGGAIGTGGRPQMRERLEPRRRGRRRTRSRPAPRAPRSTSDACGPLAETTSRVAGRAPSATTLVRLVARTGAPSMPDLATRTSASKPRTVSTNRAAGRACRPIALRTVSSAVASAANSPSSAPGAAPAAAGASAIWAAFIARAPRASRGDLLQRCAAAGGHRSGHGALDQGPALSRTGPMARLEQLDGELGAHQRAAQIHEDQHPVGRHGPVDRGPHPVGVGPEHGGVGVLDPAGRLERQLLARHLPGQRNDAVGQRLAVGDDDDADHGLAVLRGALSRRRGRARRRGAGSRSGAPRGAGWRRRSASGRSRESQTTLEAPEAAT